jgi:hypothetical protein
VAEAFRGLRARGAFRVTGRGVRGDPFRYALNDSGQPAQDAAPVPVEPALPSTSNRGSGEDECLDASEGVEAEYAGHRPAGDVGANGGLPKPERSDVPGRADQEVPIGPRLATDARVVRAPGTGRWMIVLSSGRPVVGPVPLPDGVTTIVDPGLCVHRNLVDLGAAAEHMDASRDSALTNLIEERIQQIAACGLGVSLGYVTGELQFPAAQPRQIEEQSDDSGDGDENVGGR